MKVYIFPSRRQRQRISSVRIEHSYPFGLTLGQRILFWMCIMAGWVWLWL